MKGMQKVIHWVWISILFFPVNLFGQTTNDNCLNAVNLCPNTIFSGSTYFTGADICSGCSDGSNASGNFCFELNNTVWFTFTTNSLGGNATVSFSNISCLVSAGFDDAIQAVIIEASTPCNESTYTSVSNCETGSATDFSLNATGLLPNTTYYVQVDGDLNGAGITDPAYCDFSIEVNGPAVDVIIDATSTSSNCGANDGTITINSVDGATNPLSYSIDNTNFQSGANFGSLNAGEYTITVEDDNGCLSFEDITVAQLNGPDNSSANNTNASCTGNNGQIQIINTVGGNPAYTYTLVGGGTQASNTFSNLPAGSYTIIITDQLGCTDTVVTSIANTTGPTDATVTITNSDCGQANGEITVNVIGGNAPYQYSLNGAPTQGSNVYSNLSAGTYSVLITDASGCTFLVSNIVVSENQPNLAPVVIISQSPTPACQGQPVDFTASVTNGGASTNYEWFINGSSVQNGGSAVLNIANPNSNDIVICQITSNDACLAITTDESNQTILTVLPTFTPTTTVTTSTPNVCEGDQAFFTANSNDCSSGGSYEWYVDNTLVSTTTSNSTSLFINQDANVSVILNCDDACALPSTSNSVSISVTQVDANAGIDQLISPGESTTLSGTGTSGGTFSWSPTSSLSNSNIPNPTANPTSTVTYILTVTVNGCTDTDDVTIVVAELISPPNTFTPNSDGTNDTWEILRIENYPNCKVTIYDRWGQKIFNTVGYLNSNAWDGTNNGLKLPASTYYYVIDLNSGNGSKGDLYNGSVTIVY